MGKATWYREILNIFCTASLTILGTFILQRCAFQDQAELRKQEAGIELRKERLIVIQPEINSVKAFVKQIDNDIKTIVPVVLEPGGAHSPASAEQEKVIDVIMQNLKTLGSLAILLPRPLMIVVFKTKSDYEEILNRRLRENLTVPYDVQEKFKQLRRFDEQFDLATEDYITNGFSYSREE